MYVTICRSVCLTDIREMSPAIKWLEVERAREEPIPDISEIKCKLNGLQEAGWGQQG